MGMPVSAHVRGPLAREPALEPALAQAFAVLRRADAVFSTYRPDSDISRMARGEIDLAGAHPDVAEVAGLCELARERTGGWFDADLPLPGGGTRFDPTGLVKGWAVQRAADVLAAVPDHDFCLNAGGDVIAGCGRSDTPDWQVGVEDPLDRSRLIDVDAAAPGRGGHLGHRRAGRPHLRPAHRPAGGRPGVRHGRRAVPAVGRRVRHRGLRPRAGAPRSGCRAWTAGRRWWSARPVAPPGSAGRGRWAAEPGGRSPGPPAAGVGSCPGGSQETLRYVWTLGSWATRTAEARLLVVDDEPNIRELLTASLRFAGFEVHAAGDGAEALKLAEQHRPDLVVLDVMLPDMDGFTVTRRLRERGREMPVAVPHRPRRDRRQGHRA